MRTCSRRKTRATFLRARTSREPASELAGNLDQCQAGAIAGRCYAGDRYQFERLGYFCADLDSKPGALVFNRTVPLRDTWAKIEKREKGKSG